VSYAKGARFERRVKRALEDRGYFVIRASSSKPIDLVCIKNGEVLLIECKLRARSIGRRALEEVRRISERTRVRGLIATVRDGEIVLIDPRTGDELSLSSI